MEAPSPPSPRRARGEAHDEGVVEVHRWGPQDWQAARAARVAAVTDAPQAFATSLHREQTRSEEEWRSRLAASAWLAAFDDVSSRGRRPDRHEVAGIVAVVDPATLSHLAPDERELTSMWVAPPWRRRGVASALIEAAASAARTDGAARLVLWVVEGNEAARRLYERVGFTATGQRQPVPGDGPAGRAESCFARSLA